MRSLLLLFKVDILMFKYNPQKVLFTTFYHFAFFHCNSILIPAAVPERPEDLEVKEITKDSVTLTWNPPKYDGGSEIINYVLESRLIGTEKFHKVTNDNLLSRKYTVKGLKEGDTYEYRVSAVNIVGQGKPSFCTKPITCKDELGMCLMQVIPSNLYIYGFIIKH